MFFVYFIQRHLFVSQAQIVCHNTTACLKKTWEPVSKIISAIYIKLIYFLVQKKKDTSLASFSLNSYQFPFCFIRLRIFAAAHKKSHTQKNQQQNPAFFSHIVLHFTLYFCEYVQNRAYYA